MIKHYDITIKGRVQGVGYRYSVLNIAKETGVSGFVKNLPDGTVYIEVEGLINQIDEFIKWCVNNPGRALIKEIIKEEHTVRNYNSFEIR
jgi:acylphosphatase